MLRFSLYWLHEAPGLFWMLCRSQYGHGVSHGAGAFAQLGKAFHLKTKKAFPFSFSSSFMAEEVVDCSAIKAEDQHGP